jgi:hypothetical protein
LALNSIHRDLLHRAFRASLHRLRGLRALLGGWIEIGVPPGSEHRVQPRLEEDMVLLARLDWLGTMMHHAQPPARLHAGEAPQVLLAAALGLGTPEEARERLPHIVDPEAALALALWIQAKAPEATVGDGILQRWQGRSLVVELAAPRPAELAEWDAVYGHQVLQREPHLLVMRPGAFHEHLAAEQVAPQLG